MSDDTSSQHDRLPTLAMEPEPEPSPDESIPSAPDTPEDELAQSLSSDSKLAPRWPIPRPASALTAAELAMSPSSTPLGSINAARRPGATPTLSSRGSGLNVTSDIQARLKAFHMGRQGAPPSTRSSSAFSDGAVGSSSSSSSSSSNRLGGLVSPPSGALAGPGGVPANFMLPNGKPLIANIHSAPAVPSLRMGNKTPSLAEKRGLALPGGLPNTQPNGTPQLTGRKKPGLTLSQMGGSGGGPTKGAPGDNKSATGGSMMDKYSEFLDTKTGSLKFKGKATLNSQGVEFAGGSTFSISLDEVDTLDELGKGNYGTVFKVRHSRPKIRRPGLGLAGNKTTITHCPPGRKSTDGQVEDQPSLSHAPATPTKPSSGTTGAIMAMKEIRLELDDAKFAAIIMELDILHRCISPYIIDFYGAFFQEGAVYICMEFMDGGSIDKLYGHGIPENVLRKIAFSTTMGLKSLKEEHNIIHRDVKPTNILINSRGQVKICDFGVSGNLVASIAKTNIGCQSYMAPERISTGAVGMAGANSGPGTYSVQSDIWSLGLTIIECALGSYPYPPETYNNIFSQLSAIVDGEPPDLPEEGFSETARNFVRGCLNKIPKLRPTYAMLLQHAWLAPLVKPTTIMEEDEEETSNDDEVGKGADQDERAEGIVDKEVAEWVLQALEKRRLGKLVRAQKPALHAAPLDAVGPGALDTSQIETLKTEKEKKDEAPTG